MPIKQGAYPAEFRQQIVELAKAGRSHSDLAREFWLPRNQHRHLGASKPSGCNW